MIIRGITLFKKQEEIVKTIIESKHRFVTLCASRQFSKTTILEQVLLYHAINEKSVSLYITPTYALSRIIMNKLYKELVDSKIIKTFNKSEFTMELSNDSIIYFRSSTNPDSIRGLSVNYCYIDEAAFQSDELFQITRPALAVLGKQTLCASTPRGKRGFFYTNYQQGLIGNQNYLSLFGIYTDNPFYNRDEVEDAKKTLPENIFKQEYLAEFLDDGGSVFRNVLNCSIIQSFKGFQNEGPYSIGVDLGRQQDFTVVTVLNKNNEVVEIYRRNQQDWTTIIQHINNVIRRYPGASILCETNGIGDVVFELLTKSNPNIRPFLTTNESKNEIIEELILAFETNKISIPTERLFPILHNELNTYTFQYSPKTRRILYSAMSGFHDDTIMSLAIALKVKQRPQMMWSKP